MLSAFPVNIDQRSHQIIVCFQSLLFRLPILLLQEVCMLILILIFDGRLRGEKFTVVSSSIEDILVEGCSAIFNEGIHLYVVIILFHTYLT